MKKVILLSVFLFLGLGASQILPGLSGPYYEDVHYICNTLLFICLSFIMINVGREFNIEKDKWRSYLLDYFVAMVTAAMPWILVALYYTFILLPSAYWDNAQAWHENLLLSRFSAPTSAGILFTMLAAAGLKQTWVYKKVQVLAIFDDLDTILLMIPLQIMMIGMKWELLGIIVVVTVLLVWGWKYMNSFKMKQDWKHILFYAVGVYFLTQLLYFGTKFMFVDGEGIHIEVLLPAFIIGVVMKSRHRYSRAEMKVSDLISFVFMFLVGVSMPLFIGVDYSTVGDSAMVTCSQPMMPWPELCFHVVVVSMLSNVGKMMPLFFYSDRDIRERLALSIGMFTRGEVGAGIIFIALGYNLGGPALIISVLTIVLNLMLTSVFIVWVKRLLKKVYAT